MSARPRPRPTLRRRREQGEEHGDRNRDCSAVSGAQPSRITANPTSITSGSSSTLTVTATNATPVTVTGTDGSTYTLQPTGGTQAVSPSRDHDLHRHRDRSRREGLCHRDRDGATACGRAHCQHDCQTHIDYFRRFVHVDRDGGECHPVTVTGTDGSTYSLAASGGTQSVTPTATTTYTATATGAGGKATATATVTVVPPAAPPSASRLILRRSQREIPPP